MEFSESFAINLRRLIRQHGMTIAQLSQKTGLSYLWLRKAVSKVGIKRPQEHHLAALKEVFGPVNWYEAEAKGDSLDGLEVERYQVVAARYPAIRQLVGHLYAQLRRIEFLEQQSNRPPAKQAGAYVSPPTTFREAAKAAKARLAAKQLQQQPEDAPIDGRTIEDVDNEDDQ